MSEWTQERNDDFLKTSAMFGDTEACEAGNEIIRLRAELERVKAEWISVQDSLPEERAPVLVYRDFGGVKEILVRQRIDVEWWCDENTDYFLEIDEVTHWKSLPAAPEEGE